MPTRELLPCISCGLPQPLTTRTCAKCGLSFATTRTWQHLDRTEDAIARGRYELATSILTQADVEMLGLRDDLRRRYLLTARAFYLQGQLYYNKGEVDAAGTELLLARDQLIGLDNGTELLARTLLLLGGIAYFHGQNPEAIDYFHQCSDLAVPIAAHGLAAHALTSEANIQANLGDTSSATTVYEQALYQAELSTDPVERAYTYRLAAGFYLNEGRCSLAIEYASRLVNLCPLIEDKNALCLAWADAGYTFLKYGNLTEAARCLRVAYDLATQADYKLGLMSVLVYLAELSRYLNDDSNWLNYASRVFNQVTGAAMFWRADAALELVRYYCKHQDWSHVQKCLQYLEDEMSSDWSADDQRGYQAHARAIYHTALGEWNIAERHFRTLSELLQRLGNRYEAAIVHYEYATMLLARARHDGNYPPAHTAFQQAIATFRALELPNHVTTAEALLRQPTAY